VYQKVIFRSKIKNEMKRVSVLPLMVDPVYFTPFLVLGRSRPVDSWKEGSLYWSDFGGLVHEKDGSVEETAAREVIEEMLGLLVAKEDLYLFKRALLDELFIIKVLYEEDIVFVVRFAWKPFLPFEYSKLYFQLRSISHVSRGIELTAAERIALCRFKWLQSDQDSTIKTLLKHPAVQVRKQILPISAVQEASKALSQALGAKERMIFSNEYKTSCYVIDGVKSSWLEKDKIELFSIQQLQCACRPEGLVCTQGQSIDIAPSYVPVLKIIVRALLTGQYQCSIRENNNITVHNQNDG
jgi:8-oxo-dGTP pyrophosphatase MutT (NUDIX family)